MFGQSHPDPEIEKRVCESQEILLKGLVRITLVALIGTFALSFLFVGAPKLYSNYYDSYLNAFDVGSSVQISTLAQKLEEAKKSKTKSVVGAYFQKGQNIPVPSGFWVDRNQDHTLVLSVLSNARGELEILGFSNDEQYVAVEYHATHIDFLGLDSGTAAPDGITILTTVTRLNEQ